MHQQHSFKGVIPTALQDAHGRQALFFVHDLYAGALNLEQAHIQPREKPGGLMQSTPASPGELWSYLTQVCLRSSSFLLGSILGVFGFRSWLWSPKAAAWQHNLTLHRLSVSVLWRPAAITAMLACQLT